MAIFATCKQLFIMKKILYILLIALAALSVSCKKDKQVWRITN